MKRLALFDRCKVDLIIFEKNLSMLQAIMITKNIGTHVYLLKRCFDKFYILLS